MASLRSAWTAPFYADAEDDDKRATSSRFPGGLGIGGRNPIGQVERIAATGW